MKKHFMLVTTLILCAALLGGCGRTVIYVSDKNISESSVHGEEVRNLLSKLLEFKFANYENLTISDYRSKVMSIISKNEEEYLALIEQASVDSIIQELRFTNEEAYFVANILLPVISEKWDTWRISNFSKNASYLVEYTIDYTIVNADDVTMGERNQAIALIMDEIQMVLDSRTKEELADIEKTRSVLQTKLNTLADTLTTDNFHIVIAFFDRLDSVVLGECLNEADIEEFGYSTQEDYQLLLSIKKLDYKAMSVSAFFQSYIELVQNPDFENAHARVTKDIFNNKLPANLTDDELNFLVTTLEATGQEFIAQYQHNNSLPLMRYRIEKQKNEMFKGKDYLVFELFIEYGIEYAIVDDCGFTINERDTMLLKVKTSIQDFIVSRSVEQLVDGKEALEIYCKSLEQQYSNNAISVWIPIFAYQTHDQRDDIQVLQ